MTKSQRRIRGTTASTPGHRLTLFVISIAAVSAATYIAFVPGSTPYANRAETFSDSGCNQNYSDDAKRSPACTRAEVNAELTQADNSPAIGANTINLNESHQADASPKLQSRHADNPRDWNNHQSNTYGSQPGQTMAELCVTGLNAKESRCQTGNYNERFNTSESEDERDSASGYSISGHVLTTDGLGLNGVRIVASPDRLNGQGIPESQTLRFWTVTDSLGAYSLDGLPGGEYTIRSSTQGPYRSARISARTGVNFADLVVYRNSATVAHGRVLTTLGEPLEGVTVLPNVLGQPSVLTDDNGRFQLEVTLKPTVSSFTLRFQRPGYREESGKVQLQQPDAPNAAAVNVVMHPVESWTALTGTVYSDSGETLAGRTVELRPRSAQRTYSTTTDGDGQYNFPVLESPDDYRLIVFGGAEHKDSQQAVHLTVETSELDVIVESYEFGEVTGQLVNLNGEPVPDFDLVLRNTGSRRPNVLVSTDRYGNFEIPVAPAGELVVASQSTPSILVQGLHLRPGDKLHLPLVLDWGAHEIRGIVVDTNDNPVPASQIVLQWSHQAGGITTRATRRTAADTQGHFAFSNLGPGPHSLQINAPGFRTVDIDHDLSRQGYDVMVRLN